MGPILLRILLIFIFLIFLFWGFIHYLVYRAFHFKAIREKYRPDSYKFKYQETMIPTEKGKKIQVYDLNPDSEASVVVIAIHGWANTCEIFLPMAKQLTDTMRFFMVNARNHGRSDKERLMNILKFETDLRRTVHFVQKKVGDKKTIVVLGHSLGAAAAILSGRDDKSIAGVVSISSFADVEQIMVRGFLQKKLPIWLIKIVLKYIAWKIGRPFAELSPEQAIKKFDKPVLLAHGDRDSVVPFDNLQKLREAANRENVEIYVAKGHTHSSLLHTPELAITIKHFIGKYFLYS